MKLNDVSEEVFFWVAVSNLEWTISAGLMKIALSTIDYSVPRNSPIPISFSWGAGRSQVGPRWDG